MAFDRQHAAETIYAEASNQPEDAQLGVAYVIANRLKTGRWGATLTDVVWAYMQFSSWNGDKGDRSNLLRVARLTDAQMQPYLDLVDAAVNGTRPDPTNGATHYYSVPIPKVPPWVAGASMLAAIGALRFYKVA